MWFVDKTPVAVAGVLNLMFSTELGAHLLPDLAGDRDVFDFIRSGGQPVPPEFRVARLDDLLAIRRDSEALAVVRQIVQDASFVQEERALESLSHRLDEAAARIREDKSIWNVAKGAGSEFSLAILGGGALAGPIQGMPLKIAALATAIGGAGALLSKLYSGIRERAAADRRAELLIRIRDKI